jgi:hypothetical protein
LRDDLTNAVIYTSYSISKQEKRKKKNKEQKRKEQKRKEKRRSSQKKRGEKTWEQFEQQQESHKCSVTFNSNR